MQDHHLVPPPGIVHYQEFAQRCDGPPSLEDTGHPHLVTCPKCKELLKIEDDYPSEEEMEELPND